MAWLIVITTIVVGMVFSAFCSGAETGIYCLNRVRVRVAAQQDDRQARRLLSLLEDEPATLASLLVGTNVMNYMTTVAVAFLLTNFLGMTPLDTELYTVLILTPAVFVFGEVVPKNLFQLHADELMPRSSWLLVHLSRFLRLTGVVWCFANLSSLVRRLAVRGSGTDAAVVAPKRRMAMLLEDALAGDVLGDEQSYLVNRVVELSETSLHAVMVPRNRVAVLSARADRRELARIARRTGYSLLPVYDEKPRHIIGVVSVSKLLLSDHWKRVGDGLQSAMTLPPHTTLAEAIDALQDARREMAIVTDRSGRLLGMVTLGDLVLQVIGNTAVR